MLQVMEPPAGSSLLVIAAHPDDLESWAAGTVACALDRGCEARLLLVTSGESGSADPADTRASVAQRREAEARVAADALGLAEVAFLRYPDGEVEDTAQLRGDVVTWIRRWRPAVVFTHDPEHTLPRYLCHRDHRVVGRAALDAVYPLARDRLACASHPQAARLAPHTVGQVWLFASAAADACVDIGDGFERKLAARLAHASQTPNSTDLAASWRARSAAFGAEGGVALGETFTVLSVG